MIYVKAVFIGLIVLGIIALKNISSQMGNLEWFIGNAASLQKTIPAVEEKEMAAGESSTSGKFQEELKLGDFRYPDAEVISFKGNSFLLKSSDEVEKITGWYKDRISIKKMGINNFIQTNTNGNYSNLLQAANNNENIKVEIEKRNSDNKVNILVTINNFL